MIHSLTPTLNKETGNAHFSYTKIQDKYATQNTQSYVVNYLVNNKSYSVEVHIIDVNLSKLIKQRGKDVLSTIMSASMMCQKFTVIVVGALFTNIVNTAPIVALENYLTNTMFKELNCTPNLLLLRDYVPKTKFESGNKYRYILNDVVMTFEVNAAWLSIQDYCSALSKKYKSRTLKTLDAAKELTIVEFSLNDIMAYQEQIINLFNQVVSKQSLSIIMHNDDYFYHLKNYLGSNFKFYGFIDTNNQLVAFMPIIMHDATYCEVHYIGYDAKYNNIYKLYQNILLQAVKFGIENKMERINLGHTSLEAKAILGAKATVLSHAYKTKGLIAKHMINQIVNYIDAAYNDEWKERNPFK